jgi:hypothetical protein
MEKQVYSNIEGVHQTRFNIATVFLTKFIFGENLDLLKKLGYVDAYIKDQYISGIEGISDNRLLFLLFKNKKMSANQVQKIISTLPVIPSKILISYEIIEDYFVIVLDFPHGYGEDYDNILKGSYSKLSEGFKEKFPSTVEVRNEDGKRVGREWTLYYHIFNKTEWLYDFWCKRLNMAELDENLELWQKPEEKDLILNLKQLLK